MNRVGLIHHIQVLEDFLSTMPKNNTYQAKMLSMYLSCSGYTDEQNLCLDRVVCEYTSKDSGLKREERDVISM